MPLSVGDKLGPYEILAPLGAGGMGEVYKARDTRLDRIVAVKVSKQEFTARFECEARVVAVLNHPHICQLYDVGSNYLVMEYVEGSPLKVPLPLDKALEYAAQIASALDTAHTNKVTHRDLKPANILVTKSSGVKVLDFGLAKIDKPVTVDDATLDTKLTARGTILGTLQYMSPEQVSGIEAGPRSDIFSFGLVLYEMIAGKRAFEGATPASVIGAILERPAPSIADVAPIALDRVLKRCLEKDPENRWQTARDLRAALELVAQASEPAAGLPEPGPRRWLWPTLAIAATLATLTLAFLHLRQAPPAEPRTVRFQIPPPGEIEHRLFQTIAGRALARFHIRPPPVDSVTRYAPGGSAAGDRGSGRNVLVARQPVHRVLRARQVEEDGSVRGTGTDSLQRTRSLRRSVDPSRRHPVPALAYVGIVPRLRGWRHPGPAGRAGHDACYLG